MDSVHAQRPRQTLKRGLYFLLAFCPMTLASVYVYWRGEVLVASVMLAAVAGLTAFCLFALRDGQYRG